MEQTEQLEQAITTLGDRLEKIEQLLEVLSGNASPTAAISKREACTLLGVSDRTIQEYKRLYWTSGVHYFPQGKGDRFNRELLEDWQRNRFDPTAHQRAIDLWLVSQPGNQNKRRRAG